MSNAVVSLKAVKYIEGNEVALQARKLPVGKVYKENLTALIGKRPR